MRLKNIVFRDAIAWLDEQEGLGFSSGVVDEDRGIPWVKALRVLTQDPSAMGEPPVIMKGVKRLENPPGEQSV